jgi:hypothetical protein
VLLRHEHTWLTCGSGGNTLGKGRGLGLAHLLKVIERYAELFHNHGSDLGLAIVPGQHIGAP